MPFGRAHPGLATWISPAEGQSKDHRKPSWMARRSPSSSILIEPFGLHVSTMMLHGLSFVLGKVHIGHLNTIPLEVQSCFAGDLGAIDAKYDIAVSTSCAALDYVVVDNTATAQCCVEMLRRKGLGVATFLILDKQQHLAQAVQEKPTAPEGAACWSLSQCGLHSSIAAHVRLSPYQIWVLCLTCYTMLYHAVPCCTMLYHAIPCCTINIAMLYPAIPCCKCLPMLQSCLRCACVTVHTIAKIVSMKLSHD